MYERVGISLVEVYEGKSVISVCKMPQMANRSDRGHLQLGRDIKFKIRFVKVVPYIMYKKGVPFL